MYETIAIIAILLLFCSGVADFVDHYLFHRDPGSFGLPGRSVRR